MPRHGCVKRISPYLRTDIFDRKKAAHRQSIEKLNRVRIIGLSGDGKISDRVTQMVKKADRPQHVINTALELAAADQWATASLRDLAEASDLSIADFHALYPSKTSILKAYFASVDAAVLGTKFSFDEEDSARDRLFDVLMRRFDILAENREGVIGLLKAFRRDPITALCLAGDFAGSMRWMLEAAGIKTAGPNGRLIVKGLATVWLATLQAWQRDESEDMSRTMAALDKNLRRAERLTSLLPSARGSRKSSQSQEDAAPA